MNPDRRVWLDRREVLVWGARGAVGFAVLGVAGCRPQRSTGPASGSGSGTTSGTRTGSPSGTPSGTPSGSASGTAAGSGPLAWDRVDLGGVSAYVLVRGREAAVVDTGVPGSAAAIGAVLRAAGPGWAGVRHVVVTHHHPDHAGSIAAVLQRATRATAYAGAGDLGRITAPRRLRAVGDGAEVLGLRVVTTPGHTDGHICVYDSGTRVLVAGDALTNTAGLAGSNPQFTADPAAAERSVRKLARLRPGTILVGHGAPVERGAADLLSRLASAPGR
jgi:glyoxylase-like metal-dependent hydrolase (beta-lactamase superfamily II)